MVMDTFTLIASQYALEEDALADYEAVRDVYIILDIIDTYDAAVITRGADGKVRIVEKVEEPTRQGAAAGLAMGLAVGALVALFPAVAIGAGLAIGGASGAVLGATAGHVAAGMSRSDLKDIGELLDTGTTGSSSSPPPMWRTASWLRSSAARTSRRTGRAGRERAKADIDSL